MLQDKKNNISLIKILLVSSAIIFFSSLEAILNAKSVEVYETFMIVNKGATQTDFINIILINFLLNILEPVLISLYTFFTYKKYGITKLYKFVFCAIILVRIINLIVKDNFSSLLYIVIVSLYLVFFVIVALLPLEKGEGRR